MMKKILGFVMVKKVLLLTFFLTISPVVGANQKQIGPVEPISPLDNTNPLKLEVHNLLFGGNNCPTDNPVIINEKGKFEFQFPDISIKGAPTSFVSCNYRLSLKPTNPNKRFKITGATLNTSSSNFSKQSTVEIVVNSGPDMKNVKLSPKTKSLDLAFKSECSNTAIIGSGINVVAKNEVVSVTSPSITLKIEECKL